MGINFFSGKGQKVLITGLMAAFIRFCIIINILSLAVTYSLNPFHGLSILKKVIRKRRSVQGLPAVRKYARAGSRYFFSENIPGWPSAAFNGFFRAEILRASAQGGRFPLSTIIFAITSRCRLGCLHCYEWNNLSHIDRLTYENLESIIIKIKGNGVNHIQLSGGEPLEPRDKWPTYENMVAAFKGITEMAQPGDQIYIHYAGHGGRTTTIDKRHKGENGIDETLVPMDIGNSEARYLRDIELAKLLNDMAV
jgi:hypothetical protein